MRNAINRCRRRKHQVLHAGLQHGRNQRQGPGCVVCKIQLRRLHGFAHRDISREMDDRIMARQRLGQRRGLLYLQLVEIGRFHVVAIAA